MRWMLLAVAACASPTSTQGQLLTCTLDPATGVIERCAPGDTGSGSGTCHDIDEDGDGDPHDVVTRPHDGSADDEDGDGIPNADDCDSHPGEDDDSEGDDLPYDIKPRLGTNTRPILDAFGATQPASIEAVTMDIGTWRLAELSAGTAFLVTNGDCLHTGNRGIGRDRVIVTWTTADGTTHSDHLDIRYCTQ